MKQEPKSDDEGAAASSAAVVTEDGDHGGKDNGLLPDSEAFERTEDHAKLLEYGLDKMVANRLDDIYKTGEQNHEQNLSRNPVCS